MIGSGFRTTRAWAALARLARWWGPLMPQRLYEHLWFHGIFTARVHGAKFLMKHVGARVENEIFWRSTFVGERAVAKLIADRCHSIDAFLDIGANTGFYSLLVSSLNRSAEVFAFEPSLANLRVLEENVVMNGLPITVVPEAVTSVPGPITFYDWDDVSYSASIVEDFCPGGSPRAVSATTLDTFAESKGLWNRRCLLKVDVEGHELEVIEGGKELLQKAEGAIVELLTGEAVAAAYRALGPAFEFHLVDENIGGLREMTTDLRAGRSAPGGNYFVRASEH